MKITDPIGFFDSGLGGISVLRHTRRLLPGEDYLYYGDSRHAPYGVRPAAEVEELTIRAVENLLEQGVKAVVLACNTATSAAAQSLRQRYPEVPIIGTEPALKPAVEQFPGGRILVMATEMTLQEQKFTELWEQFRHLAEIVPVPCSGLMEFVEQGKLDGAEVESFLRETLQKHLDRPVDAVVLGCTHYPFLRPVIGRLVGDTVAILDSADGVARQLQRQLQKRGLLRETSQEGTVTLQNSLNDPEILQRSRWLLKTPV